MHLSSWFIAALYTIAKTWKQPKCPLTDEWIKKMWYIYTVECYSDEWIKEMWNICINIYTQWNKKE